MAFGFFLEKRIEVRRPTSDASVEAVAVMSSAIQKINKGDREEGFYNIYIHFTFTLQIIIKCMSRMNS